MANGLALGQSSNLSYNIGGKPATDGATSLIQITSVTTSGAGTYLTGQNIDITVNYSQSVTVNTGGGTPYINLTFAAYGNTNARAAYLSGTGTTALIFRYTVQAGDDDSDGLVMDSSITLNGGTILGTSTSFSPPDTTGLIVFGLASVNWSNYNAADDKSPVTFLTTTTVLEKVIRINVNHVMIVYLGTSSKVCVVIGQITALGIITFGTEFIVEAASSSETAISLLDSTHALIAYESSSVCYAAVITFSGNTISAVGTRATVLSGDVQYVACAAMDASNAVVAFREISATRPRMVYLAISGTTITVGSSLQYSTTDINYLALYAYNSTQVMVVTDHTGNVEVEARLMNIVANTPNNLSTLSVKNASITANSSCIAGISATHALVGYTDQFNNKTYALVVTNISSTLAKGTELQITATAAERMSVMLPDSTHGVIVMNINEANVNTTIVTISGTALTFVSTTTTFTGDPEYVTADAINSQYCIVSYQDNADSNKGKVRVISSH